MLMMPSKWKVWTATVATILLAASFGVMEVILIFTLQVSALRPLPVQHAYLSVSGSL